MMTMLYNLVISFCVHIFLAFIAIRYPNFLGEVDSSNIITISVYMGSLYVLTGLFLQPQKRIIYSFLTVCSMVPVSVVAWAYCFFTYPSAYDGGFFGKEFLWMLYYVSSNILLIGPFLEPLIIDKINLPITQFLILLFSLVPPLLFLLGIVLKMAYRKIRCLTNS